MSSAVPLYGFGGGGNQLNYKVVASLTEPASPKENTIWVKTDIAFSQYAFNNLSAPNYEADRGTLSIWYDSTTGELTGEKLNFLKKNEIAGILNGCFQNTDGSKNGWKKLYGYIYKSGSWVQFSSENNVPAFTYTGEYQIVDDNDNEIVETIGDWKVRFLTSGTLTISALNDAKDGIDVFLVGGGGGGGSGLDAIVSGTGSAGGGGGGGYVATLKGVPVTAGKAYTITVGAGGAGGTKEGDGADGGTTSAFSTTTTAAGGSGGKGGKNEGAGGAGTGAGGKGVTSVGYSGGGAVAGADGVQEFGEETSTIFYGAGGGGGGAQNTGNDYGQYAQTDPPAKGGKTGGGDGGVANTIDTVTDGQANTGAGGGGGGNNQQSGVNDLGNPPGGAGGSGIVIIRNAR